MFQHQIYVGSCDTEDWSNEAEDSAVPSQNIYILILIILLFLL